MGREILRRTRDGVRQKRCPKCLEWLPLTTQFFNADAQRLDGFDNRCKLCRSNIRPKTPRRNCLSSGDRIRLSVGEQIERRARCERCGKVLKIRPNLTTGEATLPHHSENQP